jgi:predicted metal-dependent HD superfamily phosphohydrolase
MRIKVMRARWVSLCAQIDRSGTIVEERFDRLLEDYTSRGRHFHNLDHIDYCLTVFDAVRRLAKVPLAVEFGLWYHDVFYDPRRHINEECSMGYAYAELAKLKVDVEFRQHVGTRIVATKHDIELMHPDDQLIADIDLSTLAVAPDVFEYNSRQIRKEYKHVPAKEFWPARKEILQGFAERPQGVFYTSYFRKHFGRQALENINRSYAVEAVE